MKKLRKAMIAAILLQSVSLFEYCTPASADFDFTINWDDDKAQYVFKSTTKGLYPSGNKVIELGTDKLLNWEDIYQGFGGRCIMANESLTMSDDYTVNFNLYSMTALNSIIWNFDYRGGYFSGDIYTSGGTITGVGDYTQTGIINQNIDGKKSTITLNNTNFILDKFDVGIEGEYGIVNIINNQTAFYNTSTGICTYNDAEVNVKSNNFIVNSENSDFESTAISSEGNSKVNVRSGASLFYGNVSAYDNSNINFQKDETFDSQSVAIYSDKVDAVSGESDDGNAKINFEVNSYINSQGDEDYHADKQGVRTIAAIRALRNSEITLDKAAGVYGDIIAGRGIDNSDANGGKITINSVEGADFKGDVLAGNKGVIDFTLNNAAYEGRVDDYADATRGQHAGKTL